jgi:hypothetical protein
MRWWRAEFISLQIFHDLVATMIGRLGVVVLVVVTMTLAACSTSPALQKPLAVPVSSSATAPDELAAIRAVLVASGFVDTSQTFPEHPGQMACVIQGGGPYPGFRVPGSCQTLVARNGSLFLLTLTEYWDASVFHGGDVDPSKGQLSHAWRYWVDGAGNVTLVDSSGNFPPQEVM